MEVDKARSAVHVPVFAAVYTYMQVGNAANYFNTIRQRY